MCVCVRVLLARYDARPLGSINKAMDYSENAISGNWMRLDASYEPLLLPLLTLNSTVPYVHI